jgi:hypothetical protein
MSYLIHYRYANPSPAGPHKGKATMPDKYAKGDTIIALFGRAIVTSCSKSKVQS